MNAARLRRGLARYAGLRFFRLFERSLENQDQQSLPAGLDARQLSRPEVLRFCGDQELDLRAGGVSAAYERGDFCVGAFDESALVGYCWIAFAPLHHLDGVSVRFSPQVAWVYKSLVRPSHRGRGIAPKLYRFADAQCHARGCTASLVCVESHNTASISAARRAGYRAMGSAAYIRRGGLFFGWYSASVRERGVSFFVPDGR